MNTLLYPPSIDWELTSVCNHNCIHCYNFWRGLNNTEKKLPTSDYYNSIAEKIISSHPVSVQITGGEPLIVWTRVEAAIQSLLDAGINVSINTNATLVNEEIASFFSKNNMDAFVSFPCSDKRVFDEIVHCEGAAERAERGIRILLKHKVRVSLNMVVTKINYPFIYETAMYVKKEFGVPYFSATKASFPQNAIPSFQAQMLNNEEFNSMLATLLKVKHETGMRVDSAWVYSMCGFHDKAVLEQFGFNRKCACGRYNFVIDSKGNMKACGCDSHTYGNILEDTFANAIFKMDDWQTGSLLPEECKSCSNLKYCGGGCRLDANSTNNNICTLDSTADVLNRKRVNREERASIVYPDELCLAINDGVVSVTEQCGVRLSFKTNYEFVTQEFAAFILNNECFSIGQLKMVSGVDEKEVALCIYKLVKKRILIEASDAICDSLLPRENFALLYTPYVSKSSSRLVSDYVCDNNVRYAK